MTPGHEADNMAAINSNETRRPTINLNYLSAENLDRLNGLLGSGTCSLFFVK